MLAKRFPRLDEDERLAIYHDAWLRVLAKRERGEKIHSLRAYLLATTGAEALNMLSRGRVPTPVGPDDPRLVELSDGAPPLDEQIATSDQARIARNLLDTIDERQRDVLKLRWDLQLSAAEVRAALGLSERQYRRLAEEGAAALAQRVEELESGEWSRRTRSLLVACLVEVTRDGERRVGIASRRQREEAQRLLDSDPHVAALYTEVRRSIRGAAALLPLPAFVANPSGGLVARLAELAAELRAQLADTLASAKHQATAIYIRAADPSLIAGTPRPGALVAISGVLALGGATYGTHELATHSKPIPQPATSDRIAAAPDPKPPTTPKPQRLSKPTTPRPKPNNPPPTTPTTNPTPTPPATSTPPTPTPSQPTEFGFED